MEIKRELTQIEMLADTQFASLDTLVNLCDRLATQNVFLCEILSKYQRDHIYGKYKNKIEPVRYVKIERKSHPS